MVERIREVPTPWPGADSEVRLYLDPNTDEGHHIIAPIDYSPLFKQVLAKAHSLGLVTLDEREEHVDQSEHFTKANEIYIPLGFADGDVSAEAEDDADSPDDDDPTPLEVST